MLHSAKRICGTLALLAAVVLGGTAPAARAQNLLTNGDFDAGAGLGGWTWGPGALALGDDSGSCLLSDGADATSGQAASSHYFAMYSTQCIAVDPLATPTLHLNAIYRTTAPVWARLALQSFTDADCANFEGYYSGAYGSTSAAWAAIGGPITLAPPTLSFKVTADFNPMNAGQGPFTGSFDRFYVGVLPQILVDGFETESGSACHWSAIVD